MGARGRDKVRIAAWSCTAVIGAALGLAGLVHQPRPDTMMLLSTAQFLLQLGLVAEAEPQLREVLEREPDCKDALLLMASIDQQAGRDELALQGFLAGGELLLAAGDPSLAADFYVTTGLLRLRLMDFAGALADGERLLRGERRRGAGFLIRAFSRLGLGDDRGFHGDCLRAFAADPGEPFFRLGADALAKAIPWATAVRPFG